jgi:hypothetical protein
MPLKKLSFGLLFGVDWPENRLPMHRIVVFSILKILPEPTPDFKPRVTADRDVTQVKQAVNIGF